MSSSYVCAPSFTPHSAQSSAATMIRLMFMSYRDYLIDVSKAKC